MCVKEGIVSKGKTIAAVIGVVVVAGVVAAIVFSTRGSAVSVSTAKAQRGTLAVTVSATGKVETGDKADVFPPTAGTIESIDVSEDATVSAGQVIATMDIAPLEAQVAQAQSGYSAAMAQLAAAQKASPSASDKTAAGAGVTAAKSAYDAAVAQYDTVKSSGVSAAAITAAKTAVGAALSSYTYAEQAYQAYKVVYAATPMPRDPSMETALGTLQLARDSAYSNYVTAQSTLSTLQSSTNMSTALKSAQVAKDQAYAAYKSALAQQAQLAKSGDIVNAVSAAQAGVTAASQALALAKSNLEGATLKAPRDGVVIFNSAASALPGASSATGKVSEGSSVSPASAPFTVVSLDALTFNAQVDESDIVKIAAGDKATVVLDALPDQTIKTVVARINKTAITTTTGGTAFSVLMNLADMGDAVLLGMNGSVDIEVSSIADVVTVPIEAMVEEGSSNYVFIVNGTQVKKVVVKVGQLTDTQAEIMSGVSENDEVVVSNLSGLKDGATVKVN